MFTRTYSGPLSGPLHGPADHAALQELTTPFIYFLSVYAPEKLVSSDKSTNSKLPELPLTPVCSITITPAPKNLSGMSAKLLTKPQLFHRPETHYIAAQRRCNSSTETLWHVSLFSSESKTSMEVIKEDADIY